MNHIIKYRVNVIISFILKSPSTTISKQDQQEEDQEEQQDKKDCIL